MSGFLVIGFGNALRRDDGAGPEVARRVAALGLPGVEVIEAHQLLPEHAARVVEFATVVFVDVSVEQDLDGVRVERIEPGIDPAVAPHASDPPGLLALAALLFERVPEAWMVKLPVHDLGIGDGLSAATKAACGQAVVRIRELVAGR